MRPAAAALVLALLMPLPGLAGEVVVKPGETLSELAERHGTTVERLMQLNNLRTPQDLWAGSRIQVPNTAPARPATPARPPVNRNARDHKVQPGETLSEIAELYGVPMSRLVALNNLAKPNDLQAGTTLKLRGSAPASRPTNRPAATATARPAAPATPARPRPASTPAATATASPSAPAARPAATPAPRPTATPAPARPAATATAAPAADKPGRPATPDWRVYGPLQVDWANWMPMGGSFVAPSLNSEGQPLYLAVNCSARRLNATGQSGSWKTWDAPQSDFEEKLITDLCKAKGA